MYYEETQRNIQNNLVSNDRKGWCADFPLFSGNLYLVLNDFVSFLILQEYSYQEHNTWFQNLLDCKLICCLFDFLYCLKHMFVQVFHRCLEYKAFSLFFISMFNLIWFSWWYQNSISSMLWKIPNVLAFYLIKCNPIISLRNIFVQ